MAACLKNSSAASGRRRRSDRCIHPASATRWGPPRGPPPPYTSSCSPRRSHHLKLADHILASQRRAQNFLPAPYGRYLLTGEGRTHQSVAKLSERDATTIDAFSRELEAIADVLRQFVLRAPPNIVEGFGIGAIREAVNAMGTAGILRKLSLEQQRNLLDLFTRSAGEMLDERFKRL